MKIEVDDNFVTFEPENGKEAFELGRVISERSENSYIDYWVDANDPFKIKVSRTCFFKLLGMNL